MNDEIGTADLGEVQQAAGRKTRLEFASASMQRISHRCLTALIDRGWVDRADLKVLRETSREYRAALAAAEEG